VNWGDPRPLAPTARTPLKIALSGEPAMALDLPEKSRNNQFRASRGKGNIVYTPFGLLFFFDLIYSPVVQSERFTQTERTTSQNDLNLEHSRLAD
jgi:hypothetical protein